jgi:ABC-type dipeptide/oligopeptide/nickel transport system permease component
MLRFARNRAALWIASLAGAILFAASIAALATPASSAGLAPFLGTILLEIPDLLRFDPGLSLVGGVPAIEAAEPALLVSARLILGGVPIALLVGCTLALLLATPETRRMTMAATVVAESIPLFGAALLVAAFSASLAAMGVAGEYALVLPLIVLIGFSGAVPVAVGFMRALRSHSGADGGRFARLGVRRGRVMRSDMLRQALAAASREAGNIALALFAAAAIVEWIFDWPGAGAGFIRAAALGDWNVVAVMIMTIAFLRFTLDFLGGLVCYALMGEEPPP